MRAAMIFWATLNFPFIYGNSKVFERKENRRLSSPEFGSKNDEIMQIYMNLPSGGWTEWPIYVRDVLWPDTRRGRLTAASPLIHYNEKKKKH